MDVIIEVEFIGKAGTPASLDTDSQERLIRLFGQNRFNPICSGLGKGDRAHG